MSLESWRSSYLSGLYSDSSAMLIGVLRSMLVPRFGVLDFVGVLRLLRLKRGVVEVSSLCMFC